MNGIVVSGDGYIEWSVELELNVPYGGTSKCSEWGTKPENL